MSRESKILGKQIFDIINSDLSEEVKLANIKELESQGADLCYSNIEMRYSLFHLAASKNCPLIFDFLLSKNPEMLNFIDRLENPPFYYASFVGSIDIMKLIIQKDPNYLKSNESVINKCIKISCNNGVESSTEFLLNLDLSIITQRSVFDMTLFHLAASRNFINIIDLLLEYGGDISEKDSRGKLPSDFLDNTTQEIKIKYENLEQSYIKVKPILNKILLQETLNEEEHLILSSLKYEPSIENQNGKFALVKQLKFHLKIATSSGDSEKAKSIISFLESNNDIIDESEMIEFQSLYLQLFPDEAFTPAAGGGAGSGAGSSYHEENPDDSNDDESTDDYVYVVGEIVGNITEEHN